jgi:protoporphyrinogen oxidase
MSDAYPVVILGAGLTGLSAACHLRVPSVVLEREAEVGGLARTHSEDGFTFDCTGHLLHLRDPRVQSLVDAILPNAFARHDRRALIYSQGVYTPYPFQANLHGLPPEVVQECVSGFVEALVRRAAEGEPDLAQLTFRDWASRTFGSGIAKHFLVPYNTKLWRTDLDEIECGWVSWSIPRPTLKEVLDGAFGATVRVLNISLGVDRDAISGAHWVYFPEPEYSFYRVGFPSNLSPALAPRGCSSLYVERSLLRHEPFAEEQVVSAAIEDLRRAGILWRGDRVIYRRVQVLDPAYVIYDRFRAANLPRVHEALRAAGIHSTGRFGSWEYSSMEGAIKAGMELAERLDGSLSGRQAARRVGP